jgi:hypothetical protein
MSEKKSSSGKESPVDVMSSVVLLECSPKTRMPSPINDHEMRGSGGLLSLVRCMLEEGMGKT